jgi:hypothetical protein
MNALNSGAILIYFTAGQPMVGFISDSNRETVEMQKWFHNFMSGWSSDLDRERPDRSRPASLSGGDDGKPTG